jgi:hypothetical protein
MSLAFLLKKSRWFKEAKKTVFVRVPTCLSFHHPSTDQACLPECREHGGVYRKPFLPLPAEPGVSQPPL